MKKMSVDFSVLVDTEERIYWIQQTIGERGQPPKVVMNLHGNALKRLLVRIIEAEMDGFVPAPQDLMMIGRATKEFAGNLKGS